MFESRDIYQYEIPGHGTFNADPLAVRRGLLAATSGRCWQMAARMARYEADLAAAADEPGEEGEAKRAEWSLRMCEIEGQLVAAARATFGLPAVDPQKGFGVTETEALKILKDFLTWVEQKKS
jgi:hypothetical protein